MKIALVAPQPFYQERGTPIAIDMLLSVLDELGHAVDVFTFPEGRDREYANVTIHRTKPWFSVSEIRPGFSLKKLYTDLFLLRDLIRACKSKRYDLVHAVEEGAFMAWYLKRRFGFPFVYDMDSSMADQLVESRQWLRAVHPVFKRLESRVLRESDAVAPMCEALATEARNVGARQVFVLKDVSLIQESDSQGIEPLRDQLGVEGPLVMYVGNLEKYQGIDLLLEAFSLTRRRIPKAHLAIIGGSDKHLERYREMLSSRSEDEANVHFLGPRPVALIGGYLLQADLLVSPRTHGNNTPMKIYSYLHSGVPIVATDLPTHRQVLNEDIALLTPPDPESLASGIVRLIQDPAYRKEMGERARRYASQAHSLASFKDSVTKLIEYFDDSGSKTGQADKTRKGTGRDG